jgi:SWI/SNF-related matrix-associated actin-dependent regulator 1 of chromatin subfamily A
VYIAADLKIILTFLLKLFLQDESHFLKSTKSARTQAAGELLKSARRVIMLSGTPALSRPVELYPQISAIHPKLFPR